MAEEKKHITVVDYIENIEKNRSYPVKMRLDEKNTETCKKCGQKWCYKKWQLKYMDRYRKLRVDLIESVSNPLVIAMLTDKKFMNSDINEPRIAKFIHDFSGRTYCCEYLEETAKSNFIREKFLFSLDDDKILYIFSTPFIGAVGQKYVYRLEMPWPRRMLRTQKINTQPFKDFFMRNSKVIPYQNLEEYRNMREFREEMDESDEL